MDRPISKQQLKRERAVRFLKWGGAILLAAIVIAVAIFAMEGGVKRTDITIGAAGEGPLETTVNASGRVAPAWEELISSPVDSRILKLFAQAGDTVAEGAPLLQLDLESAETAYSKMANERDMRREELTQLQLNNRTQISELRMQIQVKEMEVKRLKVQVDNERRLDSIGSGTGERVLQAETACRTGELELQQLRERLRNESLRNSAAEKVQSLAVNSYQSELDLMRRTLDQGRIPAPRSGVLSFIASEIGARVAPGEKVAVVSDPSSFRIVGEVAEGSSDKIAIGSEVTARIGSAELSGMVTNIVPQSKGGVVEFTVQLSDPRHKRLRSGLRTELYVSYGYKDHVVRIPNGRYFQGPGLYHLWVKDGGNKLRRRDVRLGDSNRLWVEVLSGINPGDSLVVSDMSKFDNKKSLKIK